MNGRKKHAQQSAPPHVSTIGTAAINMANDALDKCRIDSIELDAAAGPLAPLAYRFGQLVLQAQQRRRAELEAEEPDHNADVHNVMLDYLDGLRVLTELEAFVGLPPLSPDDDTSLGARMRRLEERVRGAAVVHGEPPPDGQWYTSEVLPEPEYAAEVMTTGGAHYEGEIIALGDGLALRTAQGAIPWVSSEVARWRYT